MFNLGVHATREPEAIRPGLKLKTHIAVFLLGYVFAVAKKHLHESSPSRKWGYPLISNSTSVALGVDSDVPVEVGGDGASGFACILT